MNRLRQRLRRLEPPKPPRPRIPHVLAIRRNETREDALALFVERHGPVPKHHHFLVVPERDRTAEDDAAFAIEFRAQQTRSVAEAQSVTSRITKD